MNVSSYSLLKKIAHIIEEVKKNGGLDVNAIPADIALLISEFNGILADIQKLKADEQADSLLFCEGAIMGAIEIVKAVK